MKPKPSGIVLELAVIVAAVLFLAPLGFLFVTAFKPRREILQFDRILPRDWTLENFARLTANAEVIPLGAWLMNSFLIAAFTTLFVLFCSSTAAYALCRLRPPGSPAVFSFIVATMMLPGQVLLVPVYLILNWLGWLDTPRALVIPAASGAFGVFFLHQVFKSLPRDLEDAAEIDGCGSWSRFVHVGLPHIRSSLTALGLVTFIGAWNDFLGPLVFLDSVRRYTMPVGLALFQSSYATDYGLLFAASVVSTLPLLVLFAVFQKQIVRGITFTGMKD